MTNDDIISAKKVTAAYKDIVIWKDADFSVKRGEFVGLLGSNGAGKTTLFKMLLGLLPAVSGSIKVFGSSPQRGNPRIAYVPQKRNLDTETKIAAIEYVRFGLNGVRFGFSSPKTARNERQKASEVLHQVNAEQFAERPINELSSGELQRVLLAQALICEPELLLLDEPLANLDIKRETELVNLFSEIAKSQNIAVILIAHDINSLLSAVKRIIYIANGKLASGSIKEVVNSESLSRLYETQVEVIRDSKGRIAVFGTEGAVHHDI